MARYLKSGFTMVLHQPFAVILMFLYQMGCGIVLYQMVQSVLLPLLHRYPGTEQPRYAIQLFLAEGQFQLLKTDLVQPYLGWLLALLAIRMIASPLLNAGIYYSLAHHDLNAGYRFVKGLRELALPFLLIYVVQCLFIVTPLIWLWPKIHSIWSSHSSYSTAFIAMLPWLITYIIYSFVLRLCFIYVQFTRVSRVSLLSSFSILLRYGWLIAIIAIMLLILFGLLSCTAWTAAYVWTGFIALLIYQLYPFCKMFLEIWGIATQYQLWSSKINSEL